MQECVALLAKRAGRLALAAAVLWLAPMGIAAPETPSPSLDQNAALRASQAVLGQSPGDHQLTTADGRRVSLSQYRGKPLVVHFVYTGCYQVCPATTRVLAGAIKEAQRALGAERFQTLTIGFNLPFDTPLAMKAYAGKHGLHLPFWDFASPDAADLDRLKRDFGFSSVETPNGFDHILQISIVDADGRIYRQVYGAAFDLPLLVEPLKALVTGEPVAAPRLSDWYERIKLLCTVYDPSAGRYRINYAVVIEILVGISILTVGIASLANEWRKHRRRSAVQKGTPLFASSPEGDN